MAVAAGRQQDRNAAVDDGKARFDKPGSGGAAPLFASSAPGAKRKTVAQLFGEIVWLFTQSAQHKHFSLADLEWLIMTPVLLRQFRVFYTPERPVGVALWAFVAEAVERRLVNGQARLAPADWKSGDRLWLVEVVAPFGDTDAMIINLKQKMFPDRKLAFLGMQGARPVPKTL